MEEKIGMAAYIREAFNIQDTDIKSYSGLALAYIGDAIYDLVIRTFIVEQGNAPVNKLHKKVIGLVQAAAQAKHYYMIEGMLTEEEKNVFKRGRNAKSIHTAKNADITDYRTATGLEALMGWLYLTGQTARMMELMRPVFSDNNTVN